MYDFHNTTLFLLKYFVYQIHNICNIRSYYCGKAQTYKRNLRALHKEKAQLMICFYRCFRCCLHTISA